MTETLERNLAGYCGLYCGACDIYRLHTESEAAGRTPAWEELPERLRKNLPFGQAPITCRGCRSDTVFKGCRFCGMRSCARERGVEFCQDCASYPCLRIRLFNVVGRVMGIERKLPHLRSKPASLARIRSAGAEAWLREQAEAWRCPGCGTPSSWYRETCAKCGGVLPTCCAPGGRWPA